MDTIKLQVVLADMEVKSNPDGKIKTFSISYVKKDGELVYVLRAIKTGLRFNSYSKMMRGVVAVDKEGGWIGHPTPVHIFKITEYNGFKVSI
jgi:uncharacterized OB-fold protein